MPDALPLVKLALDRASANGPATAAAWTKTALAEAVKSAQLRGIRAIDAAPGLPPAARLGAALEAASEELLRLGVAVTIQESATPPSENG